MTIYALGTQRAPFFQYHNDYVIMSAVVKGTRPERPESLGGLSARETAELWKIMNAMWTQDPLRRPSMHLVQTRFKTLFDRSIAI